MNAFVAIATAVPVERQVAAIEAEIAAVKARMNARMGEASFKPNEDAKHLEALRAAAATLTSINCIHFSEGRCAHPLARRAWFANKECVFTGPDWQRVSGCRVQVQHQLPKTASRPPTPPPPPPARDVTGGSR